VCGTRRTPSLFVVGLSLAFLAAPWLTSYTATPEPKKSTYSNKEEGIAFRYPAGYRVEEDDLNGDTGLGYLGPIPMEFTAIGGVRIVIVEAPASLYLGTDFVNAFFTMSKNVYLTRDECEQFAESTGEQFQRKRLAGSSFREQIRPMAE